MHVIMYTHISGTRTVAPLSRPTHVGLRLRMHACMHACGGCGFPQESADATTDALHRPLIEPPIPQEASVVFGIAHPDEGPMQTQRGMQMDRDPLGQPPGRHNHRINVLMIVNMIPCNMM